MKILHAEGAFARRQHRLRRRKYRNKGPFYCIHIDQYDKLRHYGLCIHGAIDGYSRKILWLVARRTNRDPKVTAANFLDCVEEFKAVPRLVRMDKGSENSMIGDFQRTFRWNHEDDHAAERSVQLGKSSKNQRIERWWGILRDNTAQAYMDMLEDIAEEGLFYSDDDTMKELVRFCFMELLQSDLDMVKRTWNTHRIRKNNKSDAPKGKPNMLFAMPELTGGQDFKFPVELDHVHQLEQFVTRPEHTLPRYRGRFQRAMDRLNLRMPTTIDEAGHLYASLLDECYPEGINP